MKIGIVTGEFPPLQGGVGDFSRELARGLAELGHRVHVITDSRCPPRARDGEAYSLHPIARNWNWATVWRVRSLAGELGLDLIDVQYQAAAYGMTPPIHFLPRLAGVPAAVTFHDLRVPYLFPKAGKLRERAVRLLAHDAAGVIVTDPSDEATLRHDPRVRRLTQIPIGSNIPNRPPEGYDRERWRESLGVSAGEALVGYFGFLNHSKGGEVLVRALAEWVRCGLNARLLLVGGRVGSSDPANREYGERVEALIASLGLRERILQTGFVEAEQVSAHLLACDAVALPYLDGASRRRGTLMAALAHGCAIVTTRPEAPFPELRHAQNAYLVSPGSADELAAAVVELMKDSHARAELASGARALSQRFSWAEIARRTARFFQDVSSERND